MEKDQIRVYGMRELNQRTAEVIQEINDAGRPALITRHGRFVALLQPLMGRNLEGHLIAELLDSEGLKPDRLLGLESDINVKSNQGLSTDELMEKLRSERD